MIDSLFEPCPLVMPPSWELMVTDLLVEMRERMQDGAEIIQLQHVWVQEEVADVHTSLTWVGACALGALIISVVSLLINGLKDEHYKK